MATEARYYLGLFGLLGIFVLVMLWNGALQTSRRVTHAAVCDEKITSLETLSVARQEEAAAWKQLAVIQEGNLALKDQLIEEQRKTIAALDAALALKDHQIALAVTANMEVNP